MLRHLFFVLAATQALGAEIRFPAFGDFGQGAKVQKKVALALDQHCARYGCDFVMGLGDNFYPDGVSSTSDPFWKDRFEDVYRFRIPFMASLGNHDYRGNVQAQIDYSALGPSWRLPARYHSYKQGPAEFFVIDTNDFSDEQALWLEKGLTAARAKWTFVYGHHPIYSYGWHGDSTSLQSDLLPILQRTAADFYVAGHDHDLQVLRDDAGGNFIVSGAAAENRRTGKGKRTVWKSDQLGFAYFVVSDEITSVRMIDENGQTLFEKDYPARQ